MIFACDLDRTLIYSSKFIASENEAATVVEKREQENLSYMTEKALRLLTDINKHLIFVPATTRSFELYNRINVFRELIKPKYAVITNGGIILKNGVPLKSWQDIIINKMKSVHSLEELTKQCSFFLENSNVKFYKCCDDLFLYAVLKNQSLENSNYNRLCFISKALGYDVKINGRKIYLIPHFINKWEPIRHIMELENDNNVIAAGDSMLDLPMLIGSKHGIIPLHGELYTLLNTKKEAYKQLQFTTSKGISASNELLEEVLKLIS